MIDRHLGPRVQTVGFSYSDIVANHLAVFFAGGDCAEDINEHLRGPLAHMNGLSVCSADTLLRGVKQLACDSQELVHPTSGVTHTFNINESLNDLMVKALRLTGQRYAGVLKNRDKTKLHAPILDAKGYKIKI